MPEPASISAGPFLLYELVHCALIHSAKDATFIIFSSPGFSSRGCCSLDKLFSLRNVKMLHTSTEATLDRWVDPSHEFGLSGIPLVSWAALHDRSSNGKVSRCDILLGTSAWADVNAFLVDTLVILACARSAVVVSLVVVHNSL